MLNFEEENYAQSKEIVAVDSVQFHETYFLLIKRSKIKWLNKDTNEN